MRTIILFFTVLLIWSCADADQQNNESTVSQDSMENAEADPMASKTAPVRDREPEIEMVNIDWVADQDSSKALYKAWIQNKDAKYYLTNGFKGDSISLELTGGHPAIQLIIINSNDEEVFRQNLGEEPIVWKSQYKETGRYTMIVQIDSKYEDKTNLKTYFEIKMRLY